MGINELGNRVPLSTFVVVVVVLAAIVYNTRLLIRSSFVKNIRRTCFSKARAYGTISFEGGIPARTFVSWLLSGMALESYGAIDLCHSTYTVNLRRAVGGVLDPELLHTTFKIVRGLLISPPSLGLDSVIFVFFPHRKG